jgi:hypothetical protein
MVVVDDRTQGVADSNGLQPCYSRKTPSNHNTLDQTLKPHGYKPDLTDRFKLELHSWLI